MQVYRNCFRGNGQLHQFRWSRREAGHNHKLTSCCPYSSQSKCNSFIHINLILYVIPIFVHLLMSSKWLTDKGYITALITGDTDSDDRDDIVEAFNEDQPLKKSTN